MTRDAYRFGLIRLAALILRNGQRLDMTLVADLAAEGVDIPELERRFG